MNATSGPGTPFDVQSTNSIVLANLRADRTLSVAANSSDWTGVDTTMLERLCGGSDQSLSRHIYHACRYPNLHW